MVRLKHPFLRVPAFIIADNLQGSRLGFAGPRDPVGQYMLQRYQHEGGLDVAIV